MKITRTLSGTLHNPELTQQVLRSVGRPHSYSRGGTLETERVELLLKIIAEELYWARRDRALENGTADVTNEDELFRDGAFANIELLRREAGL